MTTMIGYLRVSTEEQTNSGLGLEAQRETIQRYANAHGWDIIWYEDAGLSAKSLDRPQLQAALDRLSVSPKRRDVDGLLVAKLDRLSRSVVDTSSPTGELVANVMMSVAQWERRVIGERTSAAMQAAKRAGRHMGRVSALPESTGARLVELRAVHPLQATANALNAEGLTTATGAPWTENAVYKVYKRLAA